MTRKAKVALDEGYIFGPEGNGFERINLAAPRAVIEQILSRIWGYDFFGDTRTVDTHIKRLRQKLTCEEMGQKWDIITVYGVGYKFEAET